MKQLPLVVLLSVCCAWPALAGEAPKKEARPRPWVAVALPSSAGAGAPKESKVIADTEHVKSVLIILRKGTVLPEHHSALPVILQSLSGRGKVRMGEAVEALSPERMVVLEPGVSHEVIPEAGGDLVLLVQHLKTGGADTHAH